MERRKGLLSPRLVEQCYDRLCSQWSSIQSSLSYKAEYSGQVKGRANLVLIVVSIQK